jgi:hypothetical protein
MSLQTLYRRHVSHTYERGRPLNAPAAFELIVAILLIAAIPMCAQAQSPSALKVNKGDAQKVVTIISGDKAKTQAYCDIKKVSEQLGRAYDKNDSKMVDELSVKIDTLEKTLGPEYLAFIDGLGYIDTDDKLSEEIMSEFGALDRLCTE